MRVCTLMSGSSGNAIYIETSRQKVLIDAGQTGKAITHNLMTGCGIYPDQLDAIFITHAHRDHVTSAGVLARRFQLPLYATEGTWGEMERIVGKLAPWQKNIIVAGVPYEIGDLVLHSFPTSHDALDSVGYLCLEGEKSVGIATDCGVFTQRMVNLLKKAQCLILEANHDLDMLKNGPYPWSLKKRIASAMGHLSNEEAGRALVMIRDEHPQKVILAHLSQENNKPALALQTIRELLRQNAVPEGMVELSVAPRYQAGPILTL